MVVNRFSQAVIAVILLALGACSSDFEKLGGDFGDHIAKEVLHIDPTDLEKPGERESRARNFAQRTDVLFATGTYLGNRFLATSSCAQTRCVWTDSDLLARTNEDLFPRDITGVVALGSTNNGVTDFEYRVGGRKTLGNWMTHSVYGLAEEPGRPQDRAMIHFGFVIGDLTGSLPSTSATWTGNMVGIAVEGADIGTRLSGDAALVWSNAKSNMVNVSVSNIRDNANGSPWPVGSLRFEDIPADASGKFDFGTTGSLIRGGFHGPNHAEAAGIFEQRGIIGSFGVKRE